MQRKKMLDSSDYLLYVNRNTAAGARCCYDNNARPRP